MRLLDTGRIITRRLTRLGRRAINYFVPAGLVLMYHRVSEVEVDPWKLSVSPEHFRQQIEYLRSEANVLQLSDYVKALRAGGLPRRAVVITFDDGYADNLSVAAPVLAEAGLPATFFITTGAIGQQGEFWWDDLERCFLDASSLNGAELNKLSCEVMSLEGAEEQKRTDRAKTGNDENGMSSRLAIYRRVWSFAASLAPGARKRVIARIRTATNTPSEARPTHRTLTESELLRLSKIAGMEIGAHTVSHTPLTALSRQDRREEILESRRWLEDVLEDSVRALSYPNGAYDEDTVSLLRQEGFTVACTTEAAPVTSETPSLMLPRVQVPDVHNQAFSRLVRRYL